MPWMDAALETFQNMVTLQYTDHIPDCETFWMSVPSKISSSFCAFDSEIFTPSSILTFRTVYESQSQKGTTEGSGQTHLLAQEVTYFDGIPAILDDAVDREMGVDCPHLVAETLRNANNKIVYEGTDRSEARVVFASTCPNLQDDLVTLLGRYVHSNMADVLRQSSSRARNGDDTGLDLHLDALRHLELLGLDDVLHCEVGL